MSFYNFKVVILSYIGQLFLSFIFRTSKWKIYGEDFFNELIKLDQPIMLCVWHGRFSFPAFWLAKNNIHAYAIASRHGDAEIISRIFKRWGFSLIRGSSTRGKKDKGGKDVIRQMSSIFDSPGANIIAITNDGPKGPSQIAKPGSLAIARKKNVKLITITGSASRYFEFKSWDKFRLPKPFSTIYLNIAQPLEINVQNFSITDEVEVLSRYMNEQQSLVDKWANNKK